MGKGPKGEFDMQKASMPSFGLKGKGKSKQSGTVTSDVSVDVNPHNVNVKGTKKSLFGKLHFPDVELDIKSPKAKGDWSLSQGEMDANISGSAKAGIDGPSVDQSGGIHYPEGKITFPKVKAPKFAIASTQREGPEMSGNIDSETSSRINLKTKSSSLRYEASPGNIDISSPDFKQGEHKVKVKFPKFFGKSKAKSSSASDLKGSELEISPGLKGASVGVGEEMGTVSMSPKGKSASLDLFKKSRYSTSLNTEGAVSVSPDSTYVEAEGGDISLNFREVKSKEKKGKLKFGTFGGFGSKSKGSYEVTFGEDSEASAEATGASLSSKKSRLSSSSSSESGSKGGFRFPKLELSVSPKTE